MGGKVRSARLPLVCLSLESRKSSDKPLACRQAVAQRLRRLCESCDAYCDALAGVVERIAGGSVVKVMMLLPSSS